MNFDEQLALSIQPSRHAGLGWLAGVAWVACTGWPGLGGLRWPGVAMGRFYYPESTRNLPGIYPGFARDSAGHAGLGWLAGLPSSLDARNSWFTEDFLWFSTEFYDLVKTNTWITKVKNETDTKNITNAMCNYYTYFQHFLTNYKFWALSRSILEMPFHQ